MHKIKLLVITPVSHITGLIRKLELFSNVTYYSDPSMDDLYPILYKFDAIFTNPNKSKIFIGKDFIDSAKDLKIICTASTGTNHIDITYASKKGIKVLSLTEERDTINQISSTAEHAFALTLSSLRNIVSSSSSVSKGNWDYEKFIGRQVNFLTFGIVGYGRLGSMYANFCLAFGAKVIVYDPYKTVHCKSIQQTKNINELLKKSDVISFHIHVTTETENMIDCNWFIKMKKDVLIINTSRGEILNEEDLVKFLSKNKHARVATDVLFGEVKNKSKSPLLRYLNKTNQILITPHIGGMTKEAQEIAYNQAAVILNKHIKEL